jgi:hypothetical protein
MRCTYQMAAETAFVEEEIYNMVHRYVRSPRRLIVIAAFAILALSAFGFAAANTVNPSNAGDGDGAVSGFTISNIDYSLDTNGDIDGVTFQLAPQPPATAEVMVEYRDGISPAGSAVTNGAFSDSACGVVLATATCVANGGGVPVLPVVSLRVIAVD